MSQAGPAKQHPTHDKGTKKSNYHNIAHRVVDTYTSTQPQRELRIQRLETSVIASPAAARVVLSAVPGLNEARSRSKILQTSRCIRC
jgi:hypothetical protein